MRRQAPAARRRRRRCRVDYCSSGYLALIDPPAALEGAQRASSCARRTAMPRQETRPGLSRQDALAAGAQADPAVGEEDGGVDDAPVDDSDDPQVVLERMPHLCSAAVSPACCSRQARTPPCRHSSRLSHASGSLKRAAPARRIRTHGSCTGSSSPHAPLVRTACMGWRPTKIVLASISSRNFC